MEKRAQGDLAPSKSLGKNDFSTELGVKSYKMLKQM